MATTIKDVLVGTDAEINEDLNGECFIAGAEGEAEVLIANNIVYFPTDFPAPADNNALQAFSVSNNAMAAFLIENVKRSVALGRDHTVAAKVAYIRFLAARNGLISPGFSTNLNNVKYNHAEFSGRAIADILDTNQQDDADKAAIGILRDRLSSEVRKAIRQRFTNLVCCVAYIFRVRGHHYMADFQDRYMTLWARCLYKAEDLPLDWQYVATDALHAIMPNVLDRYWEESANNARCAGTLIKRFDSAPAGAAGVLALERGVDDVRMLFPGVVEKVPDAYKEFQAVVGQVKSSRWGGSINARFYNATRQRVDEAKIGALASVVLGIYENLAPQSKLRDSMALQRLAQIAPATGGAIGIAAGRAARDERLNLIAYSVSDPNAAPV